MNLFRILMMVESRIKHNRKKLKKANLEVDQTQLVKAIAKDQKLRDLLAAQIVTQRKEG